MKIKLFLTLFSIGISFASVLFITSAASETILYNGYSCIVGTYSGTLTGTFPANVSVYYIAPRIKEAFNVSNPEFLRSFVLLSNGQKIFRNPKYGFSVSKNIYNLLNVGDTIYKVKWKRFPVISKGKIVFPKDFDLMSMVNFVKIIKFPVYTEDLLRDYIASNGATVTVCESKPKYTLIINKSNYKNLPVSLRVSGNVEKVLWKIGKETYEGKSLTFVATKDNYDVCLKVTGDLGTISSTNITMKFLNLMSYSFKVDRVPNTFSVKGNWYIPFFGVTGSATISYNGQINFIGFEYKKYETIVHEFVMKDRMPPRIVDRCNHKFYDNEPLKISFDFYDNSGVHSSIFLNEEKVTDYSTLNLPYGKYTLTVKATDNFGNLSTYSTEITVLDTIPPIARIQNYIVNEGEEFYLDGSKCTDNGTIISYKWIIDSEVYYGKRVKIKIDKSGNYKGSLIVTDDSYNTDVANFKITVKDNVPPLLIFSNTTIHASPNEVLDLHPFIVSDDSGKVSVIWIMKEPRVFAMGKNFKYTFKKPGEYSINVIAQDPSHNQTMVQLTIVIK